DADGYWSRCDAYEIGTASVRRGAGRATKDDEIDHGVGIMIEADVGDAVTAGQPVATVRYRTEDSLASALSVLKNTFNISEEPVPIPDLILGEVR
ncbi:MAG: hypothetical protein DWP92_05095, partial [Armatimonadetes bacterium]